MSGPTGYEAGGARTLLKTIEYTTEAVPPDDYPAQEDVFRDVRAESGIDFALDPSHPLGYTLTNPFTGTNYTVLVPAWGGAPIISGDPPDEGSL